MEALNCTVKFCKNTTAQERKKNKKCKDPSSSSCYSTMGYEYGRKVHAVIDTDSLSVMVVCPINNLDSYEKEYINIVEYYYSINRGAL